MTRGTTLVSTLHLMNVDPRPVTPENGDITAF